ncbi:hypothetical protein Hdeb2414_s0013g00404131 [Helianthus debilis subsp. tardiflorus]
MELRTHLQFDFTMSTIDPVTYRERTWNKSLERESGETRTGEERKGLCNFSDTLFVWKMMKKVEGLRFGAVSVFMIGTFSTGFLGEIFVKSMTERVKHG